MTTIYETSDDRLAALVELRESGDANAATAGYLRRVLGVCSATLRHGDPMDPAAWTGLAGELPLITAGGVERFSFNRSGPGLQFPDVCLERMADSASLPRQDTIGFPGFLAGLVRGLLPGADPVRMLLSVAVSAEGRATIDNYWLLVDRKHPLLRGICTSFENQQLEFDYLRQRLTLDLVKLAAPEGKAAFDHYYPTGVRDCSDDVSAAANHFPEAARAR